MSFRLVRPVALAIFIFTCASFTLRCSTEVLAGSTTRDSAREELFVENLRDFQPADLAAARAVKTLRDYRDAYERFSLTDIEEIFTENFELQYAFTDSTGESTILTQSREEYFNKRRGWRATDTSRRELRMAVVKLKHWPKERLTSIAVTTTRKSRYFSPRFLEVFLFEDHDGQSKLARIFMTPIFPATPDQHEVSILFADLKPLYWYLGDTDIRKDMIAMGPDAAFEKYIRKLSTRAPDRAKDGDHIPVLIIFREPPPDGSEIEIIETQVGRGRKFKSFQRVAQMGDPYFFLTGIGWYGSRYHVEVKVIMNGVVIGEKTLSLPR